MRASPTALLGFLCIPCVTAAHHSVSAQFDRDATIEIEGKVTRVSWQNPHVRFTVSAPDEDGEVVGPPHQADKIVFLVAQGLDAQGVRGDVDQDVIEKLTGETGPGFATSGGVSDPSRGLFRVWSTPFSAPMLFPEDVDFDFDLDRYPLTAAARVGLAAWDQVTDNPTLNCAAKGMPTIMEQPFPMEFVDAGDVILLRLEEYDLTRTIHMNSGATPPEEVASPLVVSAGRWEGRTLVVSTNRINWPHFDTVGIPLSEAAQLVERFTPSVDGDRLSYDLTVTDPATFTQPVTLAKHWVWIPGVEVGSYACVVDG